MDSKRARTPASPRFAEPFRGSFVGRDEDLRALRERADAGARFVTLLGPGGVGKTRLLRRLVQTAPAFGAALFCDLTNVRNRGDLLAEVGAAVSGIALGARATRAEAEQRVGRKLARLGPCLLALDNVEQLVGRMPEARTSSGPSAIALVSDWLAAAPELVVFTTSRVRLGVEGESVHHVAPLDPEAALVLLQDRASNLGARFAPEDGEVAARIVALLEGLPLAVELAAARLSVLRPRELLDRLSRPLSVLSAVHRERGPLRHASLERVLDHSWELLAARERRALAEMGIFVGGFSLSAAEGVLSRRSETIDALQRLVDSSLVRIVSSPASGQQRYALYEVVREYALERLEHEERVVAVRTAHAEYFAEWAALHVRSLASFAAEAKLDELVAEEPNLTSAARFLQAEANDGHRVMRLSILCALEPMRTLRGQIDPWLAELTSVLDAADAVSGLEREWSARAKLASARGLLELGRSGPARLAFGDAIVAAEVLGDASLESFARSGLGRLLAGLGESANACALFAEARALPGACDVARTLATAWYEFCSAESFLATNVSASVPESCVRAMKDYVAVARRDPDPRELVFWLVQLGRVESVMPAARSAADEHFEEALSVSRRTGDLRGEGLTLFGIGSHRLSLGDLGAAKTSLREAVRILGETGMRRYRAWSLHYLGLAHALEEAWDEAKTAFDDAIALADEVTDGPREAIFRAFRGVVHVRCGDEENAELDFERAASLTPERSRLHTWTLDLCRAHLDLPARAARVRELLDRAGGSNSIHPGVRSFPFYEPRIAAELLERAVLERERPNGALAVARDGSYFILPDGSRVACPGRGKLQRILLALADARTADAMPAVSTRELVEAAWPGERMRRGAGENRVHVALDQLRKLGLRDVLIRAQGGWKFDPNVRFAWAAGTVPAKL